MTREARTELLKSGLSLGRILPYIQLAHQILLILYQLLFPLCLHCVLHAKLLQSCLTLCNRIDYSPPGSSVHGILQARILEWVAISFSRGSSQSRDSTHVSYISCFGRWVLYQQRHLRSPASTDLTLIYVLSCPHLDSSNSCKDPLSVCLYVCKVFFFFPQAQKGYLSPEN